MSVTPRIHVPSPLITETSTETSLTTLLSLLLAHAQKLDVEQKGPIERLQRGVVCMEACMTSVPRESIA